MSTGVISNGTCRDVTAAGPEAMDETAEEGKLHGKTALVTGASRGIGRAIAQRLAAEGGRIAVHYGHNAAAAEAVVGSLPGSGHVCLEADLGHTEQAAALAAAADRALGGLDILVNNAGIFETQPVDDGADNWRRNWDRTLAINLRAPALLCHAAAQLMASRGGGRIINITSRGAFRGEPRAAAYGASKAGLNALSQSLAQALAPQNIYVFAIAPGFVETDMAAQLLEGPEGDQIRAQSPLGRVARPEEVAHTVAFLACPGSEFLTGAIVDVNGASYLRS